jgi:plastocyanin
MATCIVASLPKEPIMFIRIRIIAATMLLMTALACGKDTSPTSPTPTTVTATIASGAIAPNPINISVGSTVMWMNSDARAHTVTADNGAFNSGPIAAGDRFSYAFPSAGTFTYHDATDPNMTGVVNVSGSSSPSTY